MRVLHVSPYFAPAFAQGGPPRSILSLCQAQQAAGLDVEVLTTTATGGEPLPAAPDGLVYDGVAVRYFPVRGPELFLWAPALGHALGRAVRAADVVHVHGLFNAPAWQAHRAATAAGRPLVVSVRGMLEPEARAHHFWRKRAAWLLFDRRVCRDAALLHTTSARETASVAAVMGRMPVVEIPNAVAGPGERVPATAGRLLRERLGIGDRPFVLFLGRLHPIKRLDLLAAAFAVVARTRPELRLVVAGTGDAGERDRAEAQLGEARSQAMWIGAVDGRDRDTLLADAATLVLCSDSENFGMSVAEALASGVAPVVTQSCPWEVLVEASAGYWVAQTVAGIADGLERILTDPAAAKAMGERGRQLAADRFAPAAVGRAWVSAYADVAARVQR